MKERIEFKTYTNMSNKSIVDYKKLITYAKELGQNKIAITDYNSVEIFPKVHRYLNENNIDNFKVIYGASIDILENDFLIPITIIVKNQKGLKNLYKIISLVKTTNLDKYQKEVITKKQLVDLSEGLLYGLDITGMYDIYGNQTDNQIGDDLIWYDFIEVKSPSSTFLKIQQDYFKKIIDIAKKNHKLIIATGNVHYLDKTEQEDYKIIFPIVSNYQGKYLKSTEEMINDFQFLNDANLIKEMVIENPNKLADLIEEIEIVNDEVHLPKIKNSKEVLLDKVYSSAKKLYGNKLPTIIENRIKEELYGKDGKSFGIINQNYESIFLIYQKIVKYSNKLGYPVCVRGSASSSFVAYLLGITEINPLPPHYYCNKCKKVSFIDNKNISYGIDLPPNKCPICNNETKRDGFNLYYESFLGYNCEKIPDIDINCSDLIQEKIFEFLRKEFKENRVFKAGVIGTYSNIHALEKIENNLKKLNLEMTKEEKLRISQKLKGAKIITGQHPGSIMIIPKEKEVNDYTPICYPQDIRKSLWKSTHFDYHDIARSIMKIDVLASDVPTIIKRLEDLTNIKKEEILLDDQKTIELINKNDTENIPEFNIYFAKKLIKRINPHCFDDLVRIVGISHHMESNNKKDALLELSELLYKYKISCYDDIMTYLVSCNMDKKKAFEITDFIRKGKINDEKSKWHEIKKQMNELNIDQNFIDLCERIKFLLPKAHIISYTLNAFRIAYYKAHFPNQFKSLIENVK